MYVSPASVIFSLERLSINVSPRKFSPKKQWLAFVKNCRMSCVPRCNLHTCLDKQLLEPVNGFLYRKTKQGEGKGSGQVSVKSRQIAQDRWTVLSWSMQTQCEVAGTVKRSAWRFYLHVKIGDALMTLSSYMLIPPVALERTVLHVVEDLCNVGKNWLQNAQATWSGFGYRTKEVVVPLYKP